MVRIDYYFLGYRIVRVEKEDMARTLTLLLKLSFCARMEKDGSFLLFEGQYNEFKAKARDIPFSASPKLGLVSDALGLLKRYGTVLGILVGLFFCVYLSGAVFEVRVSDDFEGGDTALILKELDKAGLRPGARWRHLDLDKVENHLLSSSLSVGWVNVYRRGNVAYVSLVDRENSSNSNISTEEYGNIVATCDGVIEEITVKRGVAKVSPGDVVKKGDLLISGIKDGGGICKAEGTVIGRVTDRLSVTVGREEKVKTPREKQQIRKSVEILGFNINIFKNYGNLESDCDIIEEKRMIKLFGEYSLPIFVVSEYAESYTVVVEEYTEAEQIELASARMAELIREAVAYSDLIKLKTHASFTENGYFIATDLLISREIGEFSKISTSQ